MVTTDDASELARAFALDFHTMHNVWEMLPTICTSNSRGPQAKMRQKNKKDYNKAKQELESGGFHHGSSVLTQPHVACELLPVNFKKWF